MTLAGALTVFRKEMLDHLRDKRSILVAMLYPLMGPLLLGVMFQFVGGSMQVRGAASLVVPVVHPENAPDIVRFLEQHGAVVQPLSGDPRALVAGGRATLALLLPAAPATPAANAAPVGVRLITNPSRFDSIVATGRVISLLNAYQQATATARLRAAGVAPGIVNVLDIARPTFSWAMSRTLTMPGATPAARRRAMGPSVILLAMIPPFLIFTLFTGGVHVMLDSTCGERERGSFEPLLMNPVSQVEVLLGKVGAAIVFTLMALGMQAFAFWLMLHVVPRQALGLTVPPGALRLAMVVSVCLPLAALAVSTQLVISAITRSMKEAQTYLGLLPLVPGLAGMVLALAPVAAQPMLAAIPTFGQTLLMGALVRNEAVGAGFAIITAVSTLAATFLLLLLSFRLYQRETILFPR